MRIVIAGAKTARTGEAMHNVQKTIEQIYRAFAKVPRPRHIDGCPCCIHKKEVHALLAKNLRAITPQELASYASSAFLTVGEVADYLYFLPRILEITATDSSWWPHPEVTGRAVQSANPDLWTNAQRTALDHYLEAVIGSAVESGDYHLLDNWMCAIARMGFDVIPYLRQIAQSPGAVLAYFEENVGSLPRSKLSNAFWELPCPAHDVIVNWFFSPEIAKIPFDAYGCVVTRAE
jgi:hypothetical protein